MIDLDMQIISGKFRGKKLSWVSNQTTRPTTARVKESIFNTLSSMRISNDFENAKILCLFAGSGQMGIECISRGATQVIFNDSDSSAQQIIKRNCKSINHTPIISSLDYMDCLKTLTKQKFHVVFLDPPFADIKAAPLAADFMLKNNMLDSTAIIVAETENPDLIFEGFTTKSKTYGRAVIYFCEPELNKP